MSAKPHKMTVASGYAPPDYEWNHKTIAAYSSGSGVIPDLIKIHENASEERLARLDSDDTRFALLDGVAHSLNIRLDKWLDLYNAIRMLENHPEYWKARGYKSFENFLTDKLGTSLAQWKELEDIYRYASTACPDLFNTVRIDSARLRKELDEIKPGKSRGGDRKSNLAAQMIEASEYKEYGPNTLPCVVRKIKRDGGLDIISKALKEDSDNKVGNFIKEDRAGRRSWNVVAFQKAAGIKTSQEYKKQPKPSFARKFAKIMAGEELQDILAALRKYPQIVQGLRRAK